MFVAAKVHQAALETLAAERAKRETLTESLRVIATQLDFMRLRCNQLERERAILFKHITNLAIPVPEVIASDIATNIAVDRMRQSSTPLDALFSDMGDAEAQRQQIAWDAEGKVVYQGSR